MEHEHLLKEGLVRFWDAAMSSCAENFPVQCQGNNLWDHEYLETHNELNIGSFPPQVQNVLQPHDPITPQQHTLDKERKSVLSFGV